MTPDEIKQFSQPAIMRAIEAYAEITGEKPSQLLLARGLGDPRKQALVSLWLRKDDKGRMPGKRSCLAIERITQGAVRPWEIRPDLFKAPDESNGASVA